MFEARNGSFDDAVGRLAAQGNLAPLRSIRGAYAWVRQNERAEDRGETPDYDQAAFDKAADREARRTVAGTGTRRVAQPDSTRSDHPRIDALKATYVVDGAALEVLRLTEMAPDLPRLRGRARAARRPRLRRADRRRRDAVQDPPEHPAPLAAPVPPHPGRRVPGRQRRPDRADRDARPDARPARQRHGRRRRRPVDLPVPRRELRGLRRVRGAVRAAARARPGRDPARSAAAPPDRPELPVGAERADRREPAHRRQRDAVRARQATDDRSTRRRPRRAPRLRRRRGRGGRDRRRHQVDGGGGDGQARWTDVAVLYRKHKHRDAIVARLRDEDIPYTVVGGLCLFDTPEIRDLEQALRAIADPHDDVALVRMMTAGPWRLDALEILRVTRTAQVRSGAPARDRRVDRRVGPGRGRRRQRAARGRSRARGGRCPGGDPRQAAPAQGRARRAQPADVPRGPAHHPRAVPRADRDRARPDRRRHARVEADRREHRVVHALRGGLAGREPARDAGRVRRVSRCLPGRRRRAADERRAVRGRRGRPADDAVPGQGARVPDRLRPEPARRGVARARGRRRHVPARAPARGRARRRHPHRRGAAAAVRGDDPGAGAARPDDAWRRGGEGGVSVRRGDPWTGRGRSSG